LLVNNAPRVGRSGTLY